MFVEELYEGVLLFCHYPYTGELTTTGYFWLLALVVQYPLAWGKGWSFSALFQGRPSVLRLLRVASQDHFSRLVPCREVGGYVETLTRSMNSHRRFQGASISGCLWVL